MTSHKFPRSIDTNAVDDPTVMREAAKRLSSFGVWFLPHHLTLEAAGFHKELIWEIENESNKRLLVVAFRGSAKSTFGSLALPLWAALVHPKKYAFIIIVSDTSLQAKTNIANIKYELETNDIILRGFGEMKSDEETWQATDITLQNGVRILSRSRGQKIRGLKHRQFRPKLIVIDDPEDSEWVRTKENRDKTEKWLKFEVLPSLDENGRIIVIGNWLHADALFARLKKDDTFKLLEYPLIKDGEIMWKAKYPNEAMIETKRKELGPSAWQREMLLKIVPEEGQEVSEQDIHYYDKEPTAGITRHATGVDLAISKKTTADFTAMVGGTLVMSEGKTKIYIKPHPTNAHLDFQETLEHGKATHQAVGGLHQFFIEDVAYQKAAIQEYERALLPVTPMKPINDKRARLHVAATYIKNGTVLFPRRGCEDLLIQLLGFGVEEHDDLVDALVYLILGLAQQGLEMPKIVGLL